LLPLDLPSRRGRRADSTTTANPSTGRIQMTNKPWLEGKWNQYKGKAKEKWGELTDDDLDRVEGKRDQLVGAIQERYGRARSEAEQEVDQWEDQQDLR
jgi:uncharacterized protein YjbJ (UPF0337 family)